MSHKTKIIAALPAYNEEKYIGTLVLKTRQYVDEVIVVDITFLTLLSLAARSTFSVPVMFTSLVNKGSSMLRGTLQIAAKWKTKSTPLKVCSSKCKSKILPWMNLTLSFPIRLAMFSFFPVERSSIMMTWYPRLNSSSVRCEPIKPAPPVIATLFIISSF